MTDLSARSAVISFDAGVHAVDSVMRALYGMSDRLVADIRCEGREIVCRLDFASELDEVAQRSLLAELRKQVLDQDLRARIRAETEVSRNLVLAYAFSRTGLQAAG